MRSFLKNLVLGLALLASTLSNASARYDGPDRSGIYGGAQGCGGLEAYIDETSGDLLGSVNDYFGDSTAIVTSTSLIQPGVIYGGYGVLPGSGTLSTPYVGWRGHYADITGFYYLGARYYDPTAGRFLSADPLGHDASMDLYSYANGDPVNGLDPDGRMGKQVEKDLDPYSGQYMGLSQDQQGSIQQAAFTNDLGEQQQQAFAQVFSQLSFGDQSTLFTYNEISGSVPGASHGVSAVQDLWQGNFSGAEQNAAFWAADIGVGALGGKLLGGSENNVTAAEGTVTEGTQLYRVFGGDAKGLGQYYTTVNPATVADFRTTAGLFPGNSGQFVLEGTLKDTEGVIFRSAAPGPGGVGGGLPEVFVPNPSLQLNITRVSGVNPEF